LYAGWLIGSYGDPDASAELYDPAVGTFTPTGSMTVARADHTATLVGTGMVLITGGEDMVVLRDSPPSAELYDPTAGTFAATGSMTVARQYYTATSLPNGQALIAGGTDIVTAEPLASAELYQ
jgi:hypothetical protein